MAVNHWQRAIDTHAANFPETDHDTPGYLIKGTKREQLRQLGNAVTPPAAEWLIRAVVTALGGAR